MEKPTQKVQNWHDDEEEEYSDDEEIGVSSSQVGHKPQDLPSRQTHIEKQEYNQDEETRGEGYGNRRPRGRGERGRGSRGGHFEDRGDFRGGKRGRGGNFEDRGEFRGGRGGFHDRQEGDFKHQRKPIDENSAYRKFFTSDQRFYTKVIETEEPGKQGYEFKMHVFQTNQDSPALDQQFEMEFGLLLSEFDATNIKYQPFPNPDKVRVNFSIQQREKALKIYQHFTYNPLINNDLLKVSIFLQMPDEVFVRCADKFLESGDLQPQQKHQRQPRDQEPRRGRGDGERGGRRAEHHFHHQPTEEELKKDAEAIGLKFGGERPKFTRQVKQTTSEQVQAQQEVKTEQPLKATKSEQTQDQHYSKYEARGQDRFDRYGEKPSYKEYRGGYHKQQYNEDYYGQEMYGQEDLYYDEYGQEIYYEKPQQNVQYVVKTKSQQKEELDQQPQKEPRKEYREETKSYGRGQRGQEPTQKKKVYNKDYGENRDYKDNYQQKNYDDKGYYKQKDDKREGDYYKKQEQKEEKPVQQQKKQQEPQKKPVEKPKTAVQDQKNKPAPKFKNRFALLATD